MRRSTGSSSSDTLQRAQWATLNFAPAILDQENADIDVVTGGDINSVPFPALVRRNLAGMGNMAQVLFGSGRRRIFCCYWAGRPPFPCCVRRFVQAPDHLVAPLRLAVPALTPHPNKDRWERKNSVLNAKTARAE